MPEVSGWTIEGPLVIRDAGELYVPKGWARLTTAWRALRGKSIRIRSGGAAITSNVFHVAPNDSAITVAPHD